MKELWLILSMILCGSHVDSLGNSRFSTREKSDRLLREMGWFAIPSLEAKGMKSSDAEVRLRSKSILTEYYLIKPDSGTYPTLEMLYASYETKSLGNKYLDDLVEAISQEVLDERITDDFAGQEVVKRLFKCGLKAGIPRFVFQKVIDS